MVSGGNITRASDINDIDDRVTALEGRETSSSVTSDSGTITTTQTTTMSITRTLIAGNRYAITSYARISSSIAADAVICRLREDSSSGTEMQAGQIGIPTTSSVGFSIALYTEYTAVANGSKTFVHTVVRNSGTGNILHRAGATVPGWMTCEDLDI